MLRVTSSESIEVAITDVLHFMIRRICSGLPLKEFHETADGVVMRHYEPTETEMG
jgi:hypothetical protein